MSEAGKLFDIIFAAYNENRHYHNFQHIQNIIAYIESHKSKVQDYESLILAAYFHDYVYDSKSKTNEEDSADFARMELTKLGVDVNKINFVVDLILATKKHLPITGSKDSEIFLDADLSILASEPDVYKKYAEDIQNEYSWVEPDAYKSGRTKVLGTFLQRDKIYFSENTEEMEKQARANLLEEIKLLSV